VQQQISQKNLDSRARAMVELPDIGRQIQSILVGVISPFPAVFAIDRVAINLLVPVNDSVFLRVLGGHFCNLD
jgi:hypothetical protein